MFKRRVEDSGKTTTLRFAGRIFFAHVVNVLITLIVYVLVENLQLIGIVPGEGLHAVCVTVACFLFYVIFVYIHSWRIGQRDYNQVLYGHITYWKWKPLVAAAVSQIPGLILAILAMFPGVGETGRRGASVFYFYFSWFLARFKDPFPAVYFLPILLPLVLAPAAYHLGYRGIYLQNKIVYNLPKEEGGKKGTRR